ncbi:telomere maintenance via base-excision repair [Desmophyllum pertusum]|uniref:DNA repair nuclease/redox regulator APEX1 n=1 Tax=Desmophyllum pertusum TaxID=174260 RepID=A0A9W9ZBB5_9CNID|nr:telomere maintenance via base-excision repair [Desmophyllum pertusum]
MPPKKNKESQGTKGKGKRPAAKASKADDNEPKSKKVKKESSDPEESNDGSDGEGEIDFACTTTDKKWNFKLSSWNVNGIRAWMKRGSTLAYVKHEDPDVFCIQETKCQDDAIPKEVKFPGYHTYWLEAETKGYSGVGLCSKTKPIKVSYGIGISKHDNEGRVITAEFEDVYVVTAYVPNSGRGLPRLGYRQGWTKTSQNTSKPLTIRNPLFYLANPKTNTKTAGFTKEERQGFTQFLEEGFVDSFRHFYPKKEKQYSFWSYMGNARAKNVGWRLDYFVVSERLVPKMCDSLIRPRVTGSDHCPVVLLLAL